MPYLPEGFMERWLQENLERFQEEITLPMSQEESVMLPGPRREVSCSACGSQVPHAESARMLPKPVPSEEEFFLCGECYTYGILWAAKQWRASQALPTPRDPNDTFGIDRTGIPGAPPGTIWAATTPPVGIVTRSAAENPFYTE